MLGYAIAIIVLLFCYIYSRKNRKAVYSKSERIIHAIPDMVFILDGSLQIIKIYNPDYSILLGRSENLIGSNLGAYFPEADVHRFQKAVTVALNTNTTIELEYSLENKGEMYYFEVRFLKIDEGLVTCIVRNITGRKKKEITIQQNQQLLNSILDNIPFPIY